jgi:hypothetical protein
MPEVTICTENIVISALGNWILFKCGRLGSQLVYFVQHLSVSLLLLIQPVLTNIVHFDCNQQESDDYDAVY